MSFYTQQPGKGIYTAYTILSSLVRVPILLVYYVPQFMRPHPKWTYYQTLMNAIVKMFLHYAAVVEMKTPQSIEPGADEERFALIRPANDDFYRGPLNDAEIKPAAIAGIWLPSPYDPTRDANKKVFLHLHGGAYVLLSPRSASVQWGPKTIVEELSASVLLADYRLACNPGGRFPGSLQDAVSSYKYLLDLGIPASRIVLSGDSAGANLVLALLRYITEDGSAAGLPCPAGAVLWSPWADMSHTSFHNHRNFYSDYLPSNLGTWGVRCHVPPSLSSSDPYFSPLQHPFATKAKLFIQVGTAEVLVDQIVGLAKAMKGVDGNDVTLWEVENAMHDTFASGADLGFEGPAREAVKAAGRFLDGN